MTKIIPNNRPENYFKKNILSKILDQLPSFVDLIRSIRETIITNIVLIGQIPSPTFKEKRRINFYMERLAEFQVDECTTDGYQNPIGIIRGTSETKPPIFVVAHLDTIFEKDIDHNFTIKENLIIGPGVTDNSVSVGVLLSLPEIIRRLNIRFQSNIVLAGVIQSIGRGNLRGIRHLLKMWPTKIRGAICVEGTKLGKLNYYSDGMTRCEIECFIKATDIWDNKFRPNAILIINDVINQILKLRLPQSPRTKITIGKISGGLKHGTTAYNAKLGFEIHSDSDKMVKSVFNEIKDIVDGISHEFRVELKLKTISNVNASRLNFNHPLVKSASAIIKKLDLKPESEPSETSESDLSIFLSHKIPAVTLGITRGENLNQKNEKAEIDPIFKGIAQVIGVMMAIDNGVCDED